MVAHAAVLHLKNLLREEVLTFMAEAVVAEKGMVAKFLEFVDELKFEFGSLKDVSSSYLPIVKKRLHKLLCKSPVEAKYNKEVKDGRSESIMHDLDGIQPALDEFRSEIDAGIICYPPNILSLKREFIDVLVSATQEVQGSIAFVLQVEKTAISLCKIVDDDLLPKIKYLNSDEVVHRIKIAADLAADAIEDFLANTPFSSGTNNFSHVKNTGDLLNRIDQMLSHLSEEAISSFKGYITGGLLIGDNQLSLQDASHEASSSQERNMDADMLIDIAPLPQQTFQEIPLQDASYEASSSQERNMEADMLIDIAPLPPQTFQKIPLQDASYEASSIQERIMEADMLIDIALVPPQTFQEIPSFQRGIDDDSTNSHLSHDLQHVNLHPMCAGCGKENEQDAGKAAFPTNPDSESSTRSSSKQEDIVVGIDDYIQEIVDVITSPISRLTIVAVVGMGGIGKTTLARKLFLLCSKLRLFDHVAWINCASSIDQVLSHLLHCLGVPNSKIHGHTRQDRGESLRKSLKMRKYLIVFDGLWDFGSWEDILKFLPDDEVRSRILVTSREMMQFSTCISTSISNNPPHHFPMKCLSENQSWELMERKLFGNQSCPVELVEVGKEIARQCGGLPLAIVLIAGTLLNIPSSESYDSWLSVMDDVTSIVSASRESCLDIIGLSYNYLPPHLKACFLLMGGAFPAQCEIDVEKLSNLWRAEGFLDAVHDEPEIILNELMRRSLVSIGRRSFEGKIKTCILHDLVRQLCLREAHKENFMRVIDEKANVSDNAQGLEKQRHLIFNMEDCEDCIQILPPLPHLRSFIWLALGSDFTPGVLYHGNK